MATPKSPAACQKQEIANRLNCAEGAGCGGGNGETEKHQTARVIQKALAFQQNLEPPGQCYPLQYRARGDRVRWRYDRTKCRTGGPGKRRNEEMGHNCHDGAGEEHRADGKRGNADHMASQPCDGDGPGAVQQQRRQEDDEHQRRIDSDRRQSRQKRKQRATCEQRDGWWESKLLGGIVERDDCKIHRDHQLE